MKKASVLIIILILASSIFLLGFGSKKSTLPNYYYKVYLNDELLGTIKDKVKLEKYIDKKGESIKRKYEYNIRRTRNINKHSLWFRSNTSIY